MFLLVSTKESVPILFAGDCISAFPLPTLLPLRFLKEMNEFSRDKLESSHDQIWPHLRRQDSWESRLVREPATSTTDFVPPLCISARLCSVLEEAACNANSRYNCRPVHREADLDSSVSRTCQLAVTTPGIVATFALFHHFYDDFPIRAKEIPVQLNPRNPYFKDEFVFIHKYRNKDRFFSDMTNRRRS